ncbi:MAG: hypothetical protein ABNH03_10505 [Alteromonas sp.]|jgi:hypothetical protein|uniref:hypothetical protein n=1 Tax=Alteromonas sp. TaxID=232 RepID=UPI0032D97813
MKDQQQAVTLAEEQLFVVSGGRTYRGEGVKPPTFSLPSLPIYKEPVYITMAIGEGGGTLPDILA